MQRAERLVQADQHVLDLAASRPEVVAHHVERREADAEEVGGVALSERPAVHQPRGEPRPDRRRSTGSSASGRQTSRPRARDRRAGAGRSRSIRDRAALPARGRRRRSSTPAPRAAIRGCSASKRSSAMNRATSGTGAGANAVDVMNDRDPSSNHTTASPPWPARPIALRGFNDSDTTRAPGFWARSSSASVVTSRRLPLEPAAAFRWYDRRRGLGVVVAGDDAALGPIPPPVQHHAVRPRQRAGGDGRVAGAGDRAPVGIRGAA